MGGTSQMWTVEPTPAGTVRLRSSWASGKCIDTVGMGVADGAQLQIWQETAGEDQLWTIAEVKDRAKRAAKAAKEEEPAAAPVEKAGEKPVEAARQRRPPPRLLRSPLWQRPKPHPPRPRKSPPNPHLRRWKLRLLRLPRQKRQSPK